MSILGKYSEIQSMKNNTNFIFENINFFKVISIKLYESNYFYTFKTFLLAIFFESKLKYNSKNNKILINFPFSKGKRNDYDYILSKLKEILDKNDLKYDELFFSKKLSINNIIFNISTFIKMFHKNRFLKNYNDRIRISSLESFYYRAYLKVNNLDIKSELLISFCDAYPEGNLITQIFKNNNNNNTTMTLQHGQYRFLKPDNINADVELYENFISDYLLAWGDATFDEFKKAEIKPERIKVVGALKPFSFNEAKENERDFNNNCFGVVLDGEKYKESNINMIKVANRISNKLNMEYIIRLHPMNKKSFYKKFSNDNCIELTKINNEKKYNSKINFNIIHMTGVFIELLSYGSPLFLYDDDYTEDLFKIDERICFSNYKEFIKKYKFFRDNRNVYFNILKNKYVYFNNHKNLEYNYMNLVKEVLKERK